MDRLTKSYRKAQFDKVVRAQDKSEPYKAKIVLISGNGEGRTNHLDITLDELGAIIKRLLI